MPQSTDSNWTDDVSSWSPLLAKHFDLASYQAQHEPRMQTVHRKVQKQQQPAPVSPAKKCKTDRKSSGGRSWSGYGARVSHDEKE